MRCGPISASASCPRIARPRRCSSSSTGKVNASLPVIERFCRFGLIDGERENAAVAGVFGRVEVDRRALWTPGSGILRRQPAEDRDRQMAAGAKAASCCCYDPTRGIDVGTKHELYLLMRAYAEAGGAMLFHSTEIPELVHLATACWCSTAAGSSRRSTAVRSPRRRSCAPRLARRKGWARRHDRHRQAATTHPPRLPVPLGASSRAHRRARRASSACWPSTI